MVVGLKIFVVDDEKPAEGARRVNLPVHLE